MSSVTSAIGLVEPKLRFRSVISGNEPTILTNIYRNDTNIVVWRRGIDGELKQAANHIIETMPTLQTSATVSGQTAYTFAHDALGGTQQAILLSEDIAQLIDMFCCLFDLNRVGLRLTVLNRAMCPRFHVDRVPCRLVTTYQGAATEWLPHNVVNRSKLGWGNQGKSDEQSGLYKDADKIQRLNCGDVALLKGELWSGNENAGLVHRSPQLKQKQPRLLLTIDLSE